MVTIARSAHSACAPHPPAGDAASEECAFAPGRASIRGRTRLAGTIGDPIAHVQAPWSMGRLFAARGIDAVWLPLHVRGADLGAFVAGARALSNLAGFTVTMPHKRAIIALVDSVSARVSRTGVANMVRREADGRLVADNADGIGFVAGLAASGVTIDNQTIRLVGAGGAGTAIAWALAAARPARLAISDADHAAAARLAADVAAAFPDVCVGSATPRASDIDIAINATPLGLRPDDPLPFDPASLRADAVVVDIIMNPKVTALLRAAAGRGLRTVPGQRMLDGQLDIYVEFLGLARPD